MSAAEEPAAGQDAAPLLEVNNIEVITTRDLGSTWSVLATRHRAGLSRSWAATATTTTLKAI